MKREGKNMDEIEAILLAFNERVKRLSSLYRTLKEEDPNSKNASLVMRHIMDIKKEISDLKNKQSDEMISL
jgi:predicted transcriptional regulator